MNETLVCKVSTTLTKLMYNNSYGVVFILYGVVMFSMRCYAIKVGDFGMSRHLEENYYMSSGGTVPIKWTAPEVCVEYSRV